MRDRRKARGRVGVICDISLMGAILLIPLRAEINLVIPSGSAGSIIHRVKRGFSASNNDSVRARALSKLASRPSSLSRAVCAAEIARGDIGARFRMSGSEMANRERVITHLLQRRGNVSRQSCSGFRARAAAVTPCVLGMCDPGA
jgi:hypothetical protein